MFDFKYSGPAYGSGGGGGGGLSVPGGRIQYREPVLPRVPFALGEVVSIDGDDSIKAVVTTLSISHQGWNVEVNWICNGDLKIAWIAPSRLALIRPISEETQDMPICG